MFIVSPNGSASVRIPRQRIAERHDRLVKMCRDHRARMGRLHEQIQRRETEFAEKLKNELFADLTDDDKDEPKFVHG